MHLILSTDSPWNANYCTESGQVIYKVESDGPSLGARRMKVSRIMPSKIDPRAIATNQDDALRDSFAHLGEIEYHSFKTSRIKYGGQDLGVDEFFKKSGWAFFGRNRVFTASDGKEYAWHLTARVCKLTANDGTNTPIAVYHRKRLGILRKARPASLEIFPAGEHISDIIVLSFIYVEKMRKDRERSSRSHGGGGP